MALDERIRKIKAEIEESIAVKKQIVENQETLEAIKEAVSKIIDLYAKGGKVLICGNGGSAADAQHWAAELVGRYEVERKGLAAIALTTDSSICTAIGNDYGFDQIFARQVEAYGDKGDILIAISTSGNSANVLEAVVRAKMDGLYTIGLTGKDGGELGKIVDIHINVPCSRTCRIQEAHEVIYHTICGLVEHALKNGKDQTA